MTSEPGRISGTESARPDYEIVPPRYIFYPPPDLLYWSKSPHWTFEQATALSLEADPFWLESARFHEYLRAELDEYQNRLARARRARVLGKLCDPTTPIEYVKWARREDISMPGGLEKLVRNAEAKRARQQDPLYPKDLLTIAKLIKGMATKWGYGSNRSTVAAIVSHLTCEGIPITDETVLKRLRWADKVLKGGEGGDDE